MKAVVVAANQYMNSTSDTHLVHLQRQLDVRSSERNPHLNISFPKRDKQQSQKWVCNTSAKFVDHVLEMISSYLYGIALLLSTYEEPFYKTILY